MPGRWSDFLVRFRLSSHGNAIVPFHLRSNFWNGQIGCSHGNGTISCQFCFMFRRKRNHSIDMLSICLFRRERNGTIVYRFTFRIAVLFEVFLSDRNPSAFHFSALFSVLENRCTYGKFPVAYKLVSCKNACNMKSMDLQIVINFKKKPYNLEANSS